MTEPAIPAPLSKLIDHIGALKPEDNGTGIIEETDFARWYEKILFDRYNVPRETKD
jgi:hypothetical protein